MPEKFLYTLATFDDETSRQIKQLEHVLTSAGIRGRQTPDIPPHLTLSRYSPACEDEVRQLLHDVCLKTKSFDLTFSHLGLFGLAVLFLASAFNSEILKLHKSFHIAAAKDTGPWTPHATILIDDADIVLKALPLVAGFFKPMTARVTAVSLYEFFPTRFIAEYSLQTP